MTVLVLSSKLVVDHKAFVSQVSPTKGGAFLCCVEVTAGVKDVCVALMSGLPFNVGPVMCTAPTLMSCQHSVYLRFFVSWLFHCLWITVL